MNEIIPHTRNLPIIDQRVHRELARTNDQMRLIAERAKSAMDEISGVHTYAEYKLVTTLAAADLLRKAGSAADSTPVAETAAYHQLRETYLAAMNQVAQNADVRVAAAASTRVTQAVNRNLGEVLEDWLSSR
jgi:hypothetical protein